MSAWHRAFFWTHIELSRLAVAVRRYWKRILLGAFAGWIVAVLGGALTLALLEMEGWVSRATSDELGIIIVLYGVGIGALNAYALRPAPQVSAPEQ